MLAISPPCSFSSRWCSNWPASGSLSALGFITAGLLCLALQLDGIGRARI
jgi:hypothetical protein